eukprot:scaffold3918_cov338-Prasinococcus_capsulatus_cf.AAC.3
MCRGDIEDFLPVLPSSPAVGGHESEGKVVLYRDTNSWCPFCQRVWMCLLEKGLEFETVQINLRDKPQWYLDLVPTALVPAIRFGDEVLWESADILKALEKHYPTPALFPADAVEKAEVLDIMAFADTTLGKVGYGYLGNEVPEEEDGKKKALVDALDFLEGKLETSGGPYFLGSELTMADIALIPLLEGLAVRAPFFKQLAIRQTTTDEDTTAGYPLLSQWLSAVEGRPSYVQVRQDPITLVGLLLLLRSSCSAIGCIFQALV